MEELLMRQLSSDMVMSAAYEHFMSGSDSYDDDDSMPSLVDAGDNSPSHNEDRSFSWKTCELRLGERHVGTVLYGRLRDSLTKDTSVQALLEDDAANVVKLLVHHVRTAVFEKGMRVGIKEPLLKACLDRSIGVRVDSPADVVVEDLNLGGDLVLSTEGGKTAEESLEIFGFQARTYLIAEQWDKAIQAYSKYISLLDSHFGDIDDEASEGAPSKPQPAQTVVKSRGKGRKKKLKPRVVEEAVPDTKSPSYMRTVAYSNRAQAWLKVGHYQNALHDAVKALEFDSRHAESTVRKGEALLGLHHYQECISCLQELVKRGTRTPNSSQAQVGIIQANDLLREAETADKQSRLGIYSLDAYYLSGSRLCLKCSEFVGPVEIKRIEGAQPAAGRGLFLTKDVKEGQLLLVGNPMALSRCTPQGLSSVSEHNSGTGAFCAVTEDLVSQLIYSAIKCPKRRKQLDCLGGGDNESNSVPPMTVFSSESVEEDHGSVREVALDVSRIRRIVELNAFEGDDLDGKGWSGKQRVEKPSGVWALPSLMNHSCTPNCTWTRVGDTIFVRASRNLPAAEEITLSHIDVYLPVQERSSQLLSSRQLICCCARCSFEQELVEKFPVLNGLAKQLLEIKAMNKAQVVHPPSIRKAAEGARKVENIVSNLQGTDTTKKDWIRASYSRFYLWKCFQSQQQHRSDWCEDLDLVFETIYPSHEALGLLGPVLYNFPGLSNKWISRWKRLAHQICKCLYGTLQESTIKVLLEQQNEQFTNGS